MVLWPTNAEFLAKHPDAILVTRPSAAARADEPLPVWEFSVAFARCLHKLIRVQSHGFENICPPLRRLLHTISPARRGRRGGGFAVNTMKSRTRTTQKQLAVWPQAVQRREDLVEISVRLETAGAAARTLWWRLPAEHEASLPDSQDAFVLGTIFLAMRHASHLRVHGKVSPSLLRNLEEFQAAWHCWHPERYHPVEIEADREQESEAAIGDRAALMFSGGLDSCFTAWRHTQKLCRRRLQNLSAAVMVHGFDIPLAEPEGFRRAAENSRTLVGSVGLELIPVATNFREFDDDWEQTHGAALACCLHLVSKRFSTGLIAGSHVYPGLRFPWGSNPLTDGLLSSRSLRVVYDGGEYTRREKARAVASWSEAMSCLRVCWEGPHKERNCGRCLRCVGTAICFAVEGKPIPTSLPIPSLVTAIRGLATARINPVSVTRLEELLAAARQAHLHAPWVDELESCIHIQRGVSPGAPRGLGGRLKRAFHRLLPTAANLPETTSHQSQPS